MVNEEIFLNLVLVRQIQPAFRMLRNIVDTCPKALWAQKNIDPPIWQQVYHALYGADYWFSKDKSSFVTPKFDAEVNSVLGEESKGFIDKNAMVGYLEYVENKVISFLDQLDEDGLTKPSPLYNKWTNLDVVLEQLRHLQHHVGYLNRVILKCKLKPIEWEFFDVE